MMRLALSTIAVGLLTTMGEASDVWLNELRLTVGPGTALTAAVELVGRPPVYGASDDPTAAEKIEATVAFYGKDAVANCETTVSTVELTAGSGDWNGNYVATAGCVSTKAFLGGEEVAGMTLTVGTGTPTTVYCWGDGATADSSTIGGTAHTCQEILSSTDLAEDVDEDKFSAVALFDKAAISDPGEGYDAYVWNVAKDSEEVAFETIGAINVCTASSGTANCNDFFGQSIAPFVYGYPKQSTEGVWLNEVRVVYSLNTYTTDIEVVGTPSATTDEEGPEKFDVKVQFYHGSTAAGSETIEMKNATSSHAAWNGHYSGKREGIAGMDLVWTEDVGGLVMTWGEEEEKEETSRAVKEAVYCWGAEADEGKPVGSSTCQYVVKKGVFGATATASRGLYNKVGSPSAGGKNSADFYWADSLDGADWYATIGAVNTCTGSNCVRHEDQKLAEVVWVPSASAGSSLFTNGLKAQVFVVIALLVSVARLV